LVAARRQNYEPNVVKLSNVLFLVEIDPLKKMVSVEKLLARVALYDCTLANDIRDSFNTSESKKCRYVIFYLVKDKAEYTMMINCHIPAITVDIKTYITMMTLDLVLLLDRIDVIACLICKELFISNTHKHDINNQIVKGLKNTKVTQNMTLIKEFSQNLDNNLIILYGISIIQDIVAQLNERMRASKH